MNKNLFVDLFYGNYRPDETSGNCIEAKNLAVKIDTLKKQLLARLNNDSIKILLQLDDAYSEMVDIYSADSYSEGIKFATNYLFNALNDNNSLEK